METGSKAGPETVSGLRGQTHTPGPWIWKGHWLNAGRDTVLWYTTADDGVHCRPEDARLIAAAPNLLNACQTALAHFHNEHAFDAAEYERLLRNAIEHATGREGPR